MKPRKSKKTLIQLLTAVTLFCCGHRADAQTTLPGVASDSCPISQRFREFINVNNRSLDHIALPPNNLADLTPVPPDIDIDCPFLERAAKMFLWVTSPYGQGSYVFRSPAFFDALSADSGFRELKPTSFNFTDSKLKNFDITLGLEKPNDPPGQVDSKVLVTQDCRLVYYLIQVNDVYAYFLTGVKNEIIPAKEFPTGKMLKNRKTDLEMIDDLAWAHHRIRLDDREALAVELKSAWVEIPESEKMNYITMMRMIPTYDNPVPCSSTSTATSWSPNGSREALLALIGMHVVFSAKGHPEMVWATFEHVKNTPNEEYKYFGSDGHVRTQGPDAEGHHWMFSDSNAHAPFNEPRMHVDKNGKIVAYDPNKPIGPSNILRNAPWGSPGMDAGDLNTKIISINNQVRDPLASTDVRKNYMMIGTSWTSSEADPINVVLRRGSEQLANTTMETFVSTIETVHEPGSSTCFDCHQGPNMLGEHCKRRGLSHLFGVLQPLFGHDSQGQCTSAN